MYAKDIALKHAGMHVNKHVLTTVHGDVTLIVAVDVSRSAVVIVQDVCLVPDHVRVRHIAADVLDVELREDVRHLVNTTAIRTVLVGVAVPYVELMLPVHVKLTAVLTAWLHLVLLCVKMHVLDVVQHVSIHVDSNAVHVHLNAQLAVELHVISHVRHIVVIHVILIVFIPVVTCVVVVPNYATHALACVSGYVLLNAKMGVLVVLTHVVGGVTHLVIRNVSLHVTHGVSLVVMDHVQRS